ncbi:MAG: toll/interleukin-1 receptor domain-containing protein [Lachnospiraceae bacterium]|nr:toll/interleukin-1 receptor domain-containing protein [Lachnospiraceae bacterium]
MNHKCKMCGGVLTPAGKEKIITCEYCGTKQTLPCPDSERIAGLYEKADGYRRNLEFDKALALYEEILNEDSTDAEMYWLALLCEFGIEYVEETVGAKRIPTINRMQPVSVFDNANYKAAIQYADEEQAVIYRTEAEEINGIQKEILEISKREEPFDIFICYKETDENGRRALDSVLATDIYELLTKDGYKVFFSRVTLDDKIGVAYEPYIYAALQSAKIMIAVGTKEEHFNAIWVRNEWSRYLAMIKSGAKKVLIPAYKDMDPYELPEEFKHLQAINMGELGFQQDMLRGICKIYNEIAAEEDRLIGGGLMGQMYAGMKARDWSATSECAENILKVKPQCMEARVCKKLALMGIFEGKDMEVWDLPGTDENLLEKIQSGDTFYLDMLNTRLNNALPEDIEKNYDSAIELFHQAQSNDDYNKCETVFRKLKGYKDAPNYYKQITIKLSQYDNSKRREKYNEHFKLIDSDNPEDIKRALRYFESVPGYLDADQRAEHCRARLPIVEQLAARKEKEKKKDFFKSEQGITLIVVGSTIIISIIISVIKIISEM